MFFWNSCFFSDPADVGNLISGSSAFSKTSLNMWKFSIHVLLKPHLENFEHYFASMWNERNCAIVWTFFDISFLWVGMKTDLFQSRGHCRVFQICWHIAEKVMAPHSSTLAWKIPWMEEPGRLQSMGLLESDTTERLHFHFSLSCIGEGNGKPLQCSCLEKPWWASFYGVAQSQT